MRDSDDVDLRDVGRRGFLEALTAASVAGPSLLGLSGCLSSLDRGRGRLPLDDRAISARVELMGASLEALAERQFVSDLLQDTLAGELEAGTARFIDQADGLTRETLRALAFLAFYIDLPESSRAHPEVQRQIERYAPALVEAVAENLSLLSTYPAAALAAVEAALRDDRSTVMRLCEIVDRRGHDHGLSRQSRRILRLVGRRLTNSLRERSLAAVIDECVASTRQVLEDGGVDVAALCAVANERVASLWEEAPTAAVTRSAVSKEVDGDGQGAPCVQQTDDGQFLVGGECPAPQPAPEEPPRQPAPEQPSPQREPSEDEQYDEWRRGRRQERRSPEWQRHRYRVGRATTIAGAVLIVACGVGIFVLIPGLILISSSAETRAERDRIRSEERQRRERERAERQQRR